MTGEERFLRACRREAVDRPPIWFMRQAGRSLPEYRKLRESYGFLDLVRTPELAVEATLQPIERFGMDGAILFSDILVVPPALGIEVDFRPGPVVERTVASREEVEALHVPDDPAAAFSYVLDALALLRRELDGRAAAIGFAGGPFTVASYLVDANARKGPDRLRCWLRSDPEGAELLLDRITDCTARYLALQAEAGAQALQIFDTRAGSLCAPDYRRWLLPRVQRLVRAVEGKVPVIYIVLESGHLLEAAADTGAQVVSVDWKVPLGEARRRLGPDLAVQGNLDPAALFAPPSEVAAATRQVLEEAGDAPGHIFNLGHGVLPDTPLEGLETAVRTVRES